MDDVGLVKLALVDRQLHLQLTEFFPGPFRKHHPPKGVGHWTYGILSSKSIALWECTEASTKGGISRGR